MQNLSPEQIEDIKSRISKASEEIKPILEKYEVRQGSEPFMVNIGNGLFTLSSREGYVDTKYVPKPEQKEEVLKENV